MPKATKRVWVLAGQLAYLLTKPVLGQLVRGTHRTRVLIVYGDEYLALKHWVGNDSWMLPGGGKHKGEDSLAAAQREVQEEIGLTLPDEALQLIGQYQCHSNGFKFSYDLYVVRLPQKPDLKLQRLEILSAVWLNRQQTIGGKVSLELEQALQNWPQ